MTKTSNHSSRILFLVFILFILLSITATYYDTIIARDFVIIDDTPKEILNFEVE